MPEWVRPAPDGKIIIEEDRRIDALVEQLEVMPTLSNYGEHQFSRRLARPILATEAARKDAAARMLDEGRGHGRAGITLDLEDLGPQERTLPAHLGEAAGPRP